jgi:hypothetical protein
MLIAFTLFDAVADPNSSPALEWTTRIGCVSRNRIGHRDGLDTSPTTGANISLCLALEDLG